MKTVNVSLIITVLNEERTIKSLLDSIACQTCMPRELIIVDGGSKDNTCDVIEHYVGKLPIQLVIAPNVNISQGRNIAIHKAKSNVIAVTDGGCILRNNWLEEIISPFENYPETDVVSGVFKPYCESEFETIASEILFPQHIDQIKNESFLPSSRSVAFKKSAWEKAGMYPEWTATAEDTLFDLNLKKNGCVFKLSKSAVVYWRIAKSQKEIFHRYFNYAKGEIAAWLFPVKYITRFTGFFIIFIFLFFLPFGVLSFFLIIGLIVGGLYIKRLRGIRMTCFRKKIAALGIALVVELALSLGYLKGLTILISRKIGRG